MDEKTKLKQDFDNCDTLNFKYHIYLQDIQNKLLAIDQQVDALLALCVEELSQDPNEREERIKKMDVLCREQKNYEKMYQDIFEKKANEEKKLKELYMKWIEQKKKDLSPIDVALGASSISIQTPFAGDNNLVFSSNLRNDQILIKDNQKVSVEFIRNPEGSNLESEFIEKKTYYGFSLKVTVDGSKACAKFLTKLDSKQQNMIKDTAKSRKQVGHRMLVSPIGFTQYTADPMQRGEYNRESGPEFKQCICICYDYLTNGSLKDYLCSRKEDSLFPLLTKIGIIKDIYSGLIWLHSQGFKHLRLKPSNILFDKDWKVKIADYGLPFITTFLKDSNLLYENHYCQYFAPECFSNTPEIKSDVWSFGMLIYTILNDKEPFSEANSYQMVEKNVQEIANGKKLPMTNSYSLPSGIVDMYESFLKPLPYRVSLHDRPIPPWDNIIKDIFPASEFVKEIWSDADPGGKLSVSWKVFYKSFFDKVIKKTEYVKEEMRFERILRMLIIPHKLYDGCEMVSFQEFTNFSQHFPPFPASCIFAPDYLQKLEEFVKRTYFYGLLGRVETEKILKTAGRKTYLVRQSANTAFQICISIFDKQHFDHITPKFDKKDFLSFVEEYIGNLEGFTLATDNMVLRQKEAKLSPEIKIY